jgi:hypothetical protein
VYALPLFVHHVPVWNAGISQESSRNFTGKTQEQKIFPTFQTGPSVNTSHVCNVSQV